MKISRWGAVACLIVMLCGSASARDCNSDPNLGQADLNACAADNFSQANAALNKKYRLIMSCLQPTSPEARPLIEAQRAWLKFRDSECKFQGSASEGGSAQPMVVGGCLDGLTRQRIKDLDYYLSCAEGDLSCPTFHCGFTKDKTKQP